jgi:NADPH-dependent curcumin reductase CurA
MQSREIRLASRPTGTPTAANFALASAEVPAPADGQVLVRNLFMSVDPYMRGRMNDAKSYVPPFQVGAALEGGAVGEVIESRAPGIAKGAIVTSMKGWREHFVADARDVRVVDGSIAPLSIYLGALGTTGFTAWVGLDLVNVKSGDVVFVSGAAGAVGSIAGQLAKIRGCRVVGSAGSADKVRTLVDELGFDAAFNYKEGDVYGQLKKAAPDGIDVYFDNVGGEHLEAAMTAMRTHGRISACGSISRYNDTTAAPGPRNMFFIVTKRLTIRGFIVFDHNKRLPEFLAEVTPYLADGRLKVKETVVTGLEHAPKAFIDLFSGENVGKMVVKI